MTRVNDLTGDQRTFKSCAIRELPVLLEQSWREQDRTSSAIDAFKSEMVNGNDRFLGFIQARLSHEQG